MTLYDCWHDGMSLFREKVEAETPRQAAIEFSHYGYNCVQVVESGKPLWQARTEVVNKPEPDRGTGGYGQDPEFANA